MDLFSLLGYLLDYMTGGIASAAAAVTDHLWRLLNSNFTAALAGALAGAYTAQQIAETSEQKRARLEEIRATNVAIGLAYVIVNTFCTLKSEHIKRLVSDYNKHFAEFEEARNAAKEKTGAEPLIVEIRADFQTVPNPPTPLVILEQLLFEKVSLSGRALFAFATLTQVVGSLSDIMQARNNLIAEYKTRSPIPPRELASLYFGIPDTHGHVDARYRDSLRAIGDYTDDCIFYSHLLMKDLAKHGEQLVRMTGERAPRLSEPDFSKAVSSGLIPPDSQYQEWLAGIVVREVQPPKSAFWDWRARLMARKRKSSGSRS